MSTHRWSALSFVINLCLVVWVLEVAAAFDRMHEAVPVQQRVLRCSVVLRPPHGPEPGGDRCLYTTLYLRPWLRALGAHVSISL